MSVQRSQHQGHLTFALTALIAIYALWSGNRFPRYKKVRIFLDRWPERLDGFRIIQISDLHIGPLRGNKFAAKVVDRCNREKPQLVAITGDTVDGLVEKMQDDLKPLGQLNTDLGTYIITGNHEHYYDAAAWCQAFEKLGLKVLRNQNHVIEFKSERFVLAGAFDHHGGVTAQQMLKEDIPAALAGRPNELATILLAHNPTSFHEAIQHDVDLQISGHTHGGQIWPFRYLVKLSVGFVAGLYQRGKSQLYVSRGTGSWGPPMRLFAPQELTIIELFHRKVT